MKKVYTTIFALTVLASVSYSQVDEGLVAHYDFANGAIDISGNDKHGTAVNTQAAEDRFGNTGMAVTLNGTDSYIVLPDSLLAQDSLSVSLWFKTTEEGALLGHQSGQVLASSSQRVPLAYIGQDSALYGGFWKGSVTSINQDQEHGKYNDGQWHHLVMTVGQGRGQEFYVDNQMTGSDGTYSFLPNMVYNQLGLAFGPGWPQTNGGWHYFEGDMDDVRVYHKKIDAAIVDSLFNAPNPVDPLPVPQLNVGLIATYDFNNQTAKDGSGNNNDGVMVDVGPATDRFGNEANAFNFNGTSSHVKMPEGLLIQDSVSVSLWFRTDNYGSLLGHQDNEVMFSSSQRVPLAYIGMDSVMYGGFWTGTVISPNADQTKAKYNDGQWHHLVMTVAKGRGQEFYLDNKLTGEHNNYSYLPNMVYNQIGAGNGPSWPGTNGGWFYFNGDIDDVNVYDRKLNAGDVDSLYKMPDPGPVVGMRNVETHSGVEVYPNPAADVLRIAGAFNVTAVSVLDNAGRVVEAAWDGRNLLDVSNLSPGLYHLNLVTGEGQEHARFIKR